MDTHPAEEMLKLSMRTLWALYAVFCFSIVIYAAIVVLISTTGAPPAALSETAGSAPAAHWQILLGAVGLVSVYLQHRLLPVLLRRGRIWKETQSLDQLAARLKQPEDPEDPDPRRRALGTAVQHLLARIVMAHLVLWLIAEVPAFVGLLDYFIGTRSNIYLVLIALSVVAFVISRPSRERIRDILQPLFGSGRWEVAQ